MGNKTLALCCYETRASVGGVTVTMRWAYGVGVWRRGSSCVAGLGGLK